MGLLPTPSYIDTLHSYNNKKILLIYALEGDIISHNQYRWISNIKLGFKEFLFVPFKFEEEFCISDTTEITGNIYTIDELSRAFKAPVIIYPKIMYPSTKKDIYRNLCWYGKRLIHQKCFTKEAMTAAALLMNEKLDDKYQNKELHKKVLGAYMFMLENEEDFKKKLTKQQLKEAHSKGGQIRKAQRVQNTQERIDQLLQDDTYIKPNRKVNKTLLAKALNLHRRTLDKYL